MIPQQDSTVNAMRLKVRRLTVSSGENNLTTTTIDQALNTFILQDFPYAIKLDQMRSVYTFYTVPNVARYATNPTFNQGFRSPVYFEGIQGFYYKDRQQFYNMWPRWPSQSVPFSGDGMTQLFNFTIQPIPILPLEFTLNVPDNFGNTLVVSDDGAGNLYWINPNTVVPNPGLPTALPGMVNNNLSNTVNVGGNNYQTYPGDLQKVFVGNVNYITGATTINYALAGLIPGSAPANLWVCQYTVGRPYTLLFWNNYFEVRPVPDQSYKVEVETYMTPVQFLESTDIPLINQWWQYISYGASMEILRERQDYEGVENLREGFMRQEALVLERQGVEEINQRNATIFSESTPTQGWNQGQGWPY